MPTAYGGTLSERRMSCRNWRGKSHEQCVERSNTVRRRRKPAIGASYPLLRIRIRVPAGYTNHDRSRQTPSGLPPAIGLGGTGEEPDDKTRRGPVRRGFMCRRRYENAGASASIDNGSISRVARSGQFDRLGCSDGEDTPP